LDAASGGTASHPLPFNWATGFDVVPLTPVGLALNTTVSGLSLAQGQTYYSCVVATNNAGLKSFLSSGGVTVDTTPAVITELGQGIQPPSITVQSYTDMLFAYFAATDE
jgi:hypothetical protein